MKAQHLICIYRFLNQVNKFKIIYFSSILSDEHVGKNPHQASNSTYILRDETTRKITVTEKGEIIYE